MTENERYQVDANVEAKQQFTKIAIEEDDEEDDQMERNG